MPIRRFRPNASETTNFRALPAQTHQRSPLADPLRWLPIVEAITQAGHRGERMNRLMDGLEMALLSDRLIAFLDTLLLCLGLTMTVAAVGPLLESATAKIWRRPARPLRPRENYR